MKWFIGTTCGGSLLSKRIIASAFHCTVKSSVSKKKSCDHSDGKRVAIIGAHDVYTESSLKISITDIKAPPNVPFNQYKKESNDFALMILKDPVQWNEKGKYILNICIMLPSNNFSVGPICLPAPNQEFDEKVVIAAGWGRFAPHTQNESQSTRLQVVPLKVSPKRYTAVKMFGTYLSKNKEGVTQDVCSGDSGNH